MAPLTPTRRAFLNGLINVSKGFLNFGITIAITPLLIRYLGNDAFGIWSLLALFLTYIVLIDLGVSGATAKLLSEVHLFEKDKIRKLISSSLILLLGMGLGAIVVVACVFFSFETSPFLLGLSERETKLVLSGTAAICVVGLLSNGAQYILYGLHRLDIANYITAVIIILQAAGSVAVLRYGWGLSGLILVFTTCAFLSLVACMVAIRRVTAPGLLLEAPSMECMKKIVRFGVYLQLYALMSVYYFYAAKVVVGYLLPLFMVALYEVALRIPLLLRQGVLSVLGPLMPAVSHLEARGDSEEVRSLLRFALRGAVLIGIPLFIGVAIFADSLVHIWVGRQFEQSIWPLRVLCLSFALSIFPDIAWYFLVGVARHNKAAYHALAHVALGVLLSYGLGHVWGLLGVAMGTLACAATANFSFFRLLVVEKMIDPGHLPLALTAKVSVVAGAVFLGGEVLLRQFELSRLSLTIALIGSLASYLAILPSSGILVQPELALLQRAVQKASAVLPRSLRWTSLH